MRPLAIDLFTGLHGWAHGLIAEGWFVIGVDITDMSAKVGEPKPEHFALLVQDVLTLHGAQFKDADLIVSSSPCTDYAYMAMPWTRAKAKAAAIRADQTGEELRKLNALYDAQFRLQREASEAKGHHIPMIVENVRGARPWVGPAAWNFGSYYLWGDVPALMPQPVKATKVPGFRFDGSGRSFQTASVNEATKSTGGSWFNIGAPGQKGVRRNPVVNAGGSVKVREKATASISKIPDALSRHIGRVYYPRMMRERRPRSASKGTASALGPRNKTAPAPEGLHDAPE